MAYPEKPLLTYSYTGFQASQGDNSFPGVPLDADLADVKGSVDATIDFLKGIARADGKLANGSVTRSALAADVQLGLATPTAWAAATAYADDDTVTFGNGLYLATAAHTSTSFAGDLAAGRWEKLAQFELNLVPEDGSVTTAKIVDASVTTAKLVNEAVTGDKIGTGAIQSRHLSGGLMPVGAETDFAGINLPAGWLWCDGANISRTTYAALFEAITLATVGDVAAASATLTNIPIDLRLKGLEGALVEGTGIPAGAFIVTITANTIVLNATATSTGAARALRILPHGADGSLVNFNVPDKRGRVSAGRDNMGGTTAGRLSSGTVIGVNLGATGGSQTHTLTQGQLPAIVPTGSVSIGVNGSHNHSYTAPAGNNGSTVASGGPSTSDSGAVTSFAGEHTHSATLSMNVLGSGQAHLNVQPTAISNRIIYAGV